MLELRDVGKSFSPHQADVAAMAGVDIDVKRGEFFILLGPSGCGKTTTLRSIAGLEKPDTGSIRIDGNTVVSAKDGIFIRPEYRDIGMVFQSYAVWPHMSVYDNIAFPLREGVRRVRADEVRRRVTEMLDLMGLSDIATRSAATLSGGQQQRVAIARGLALRPKVLLMDEPLSNLDLTLQMSLRVELKKLTRAFHVTTIHVTHNQAEAMEMGDRLAVMQGGRIRQCSTPQEIYSDPWDEFIARFIGEISLLPATFSGEEHGLVVLTTSLGPMRARGAAARPLHRDGPCFFGVRPEDLELIADKAQTLPDDNILEAEVLHSRFTGDAWVHTAQAAGETVYFRTHNAANLAKGERVRLRADPRRCVAVPKHYAAAARSGDGERFVLGAMGEVVAQ